MFLSSILIFREYSLKRGLIKAFKMNPKIERILILFIYELVAFLISDLLLCLLALLIYQKLIPETLTESFILAVYAISAAIAGVLTGRKKLPVYVASTEGVVYFLIVFILSVLFKDTTISFTEGISSLIICSASATLGGLLGRGKFPFLQKTLYHSK